MEEHCFWNPDSYPRIRVKTWIRIRIEVKIKEKGRGWGGVDVYNGGVEAQNGSVEGLSFLDIWRYTKRLSFPVAVLIF
jgi:hypothetical protein